MVCSQGERVGGHEAGLARVREGRCGVGHVEAELLHSISDARARRTESLVLLPFGFNKLSSQYSR